MTHENDSVRVSKFPLEQRMAKALDTAKIEYRTDYEGGVESHLDFYMQKEDVHIEVKGGHSPRISVQMKRSKNVIVAQGEKAVQLLATLIEQKRNVSVAAVHYSALLGAILGRADALRKSCNSYHINHQGGVLRGLVWAYLGDDPGLIDDSEQLGNLLGGTIEEHGGGNGLVLVPNAPDQVSGANNQKPI